MDDKAVNAAGAPRGRRGPYAKSQEVRRRILDACITEFGQSGFFGATTKDIAARAGISQPGLMHHFRTKEELLIAVMDQRREEAGATLREARGRDLDRELTLLRYSEQHRGIARLDSMLNTEATNPRHPGHQATAERIGSFRQFNTGVFQRLKEQGRLKVDLPPDVLATLLIAVSDGVQLQWLYDESIGLVDHVAAFIDAVVAPPPSADDRANEDPNGVANP